ncbi:MAG: APC family permease [Candidatus Dormibacteraeota bacterium]|nr:APC family permease [Candidatus Dormibacteraeota bacterium]
MSEHAAGGDRTDHTNQDDQADQDVRIPRQELGGLRSQGPGRLVATQPEQEAPSGLTRAVEHVRTFLTGRPLDTEALGSERLSIARALPILSSDALSSVAYGPEAGLTVLAAAGAGALLLNVPLGLAIAALMVIVTTSYRQIVHGYQRGGGSYAVARANLGLGFGLVAAAALLIDYVLTVAVSVSSGVAALSSAFTALTPYKVPLALAFVGLLMLANLRGAREAGAVFAGPTYLFVGSLLLLIAAGLVRAAVSPTHQPGQYAPIHPEQSLTALLVLTAFASGASSMTGIEAVSNSVPVFERPEAGHAARTLTILGALLVVLFLGVVALDYLYGSEPQPGGSPTVLSEIARTVFSGPAWPLYYVIQFATLLVLVLAANTSFNGFPRLSAVLARDGFLPRRFAHLGNRLVYSTAIGCLAVVAALLILVFRASTNELINLYALGVFTAFTLAQAGMARHWWRDRSTGWQVRLAINGCGAIVTTVVGAVIIVTKAPRGAWVVLVIVPLLVLAFWSTSRAYASVRRRVAALGDDTHPARATRAVVPMERLDGHAEAAIAYATAVFGDVVAVHEAGTQVDEDRFRAACEDRATSRLQVGTVGDALHPQPSAEPSTLTVVLPQGARVGPHRALGRRRDVVFVRAPARPPAEPAQHVAIVPVLDLDPVGRRALAYALAIAPKVIAVHVEAGDPDPPQERRQRSVGERLRAWQRHPEVGAPGQLFAVTIESPHRSVVEPLAAYVETWRKAHPGPICTVVLPHLAVDRWWAPLLHNHRTFWIKANLRPVSTVAVAGVTVRLEPRR